MCENGFVRAPADDRKVPTVVLAAPVLLGLLLFHFVAVGLHVCPPNPVSLSARPWVQAYLSPYFVQRWRLFAPDPGGRNELLHVRCHLREGSTRSSTDWIDVTTPIIQAHQRNRLGAPSRVLRAYRPQLGVARDLERRAIKHLDGELAEWATRRLDEEAAAVFDQGKAHVQRIASAECKRRFATHQVAIEQVEARLITVAVPPFGRRGVNVEVREGTALNLSAMDYVEVDL